MKPILRITTFLLAAASLTGCSKVLIVVDNPVAGSWVLTSASEKDAYGWYPITTGLEGGVFNLYNDGSATYSDPRVTMQGSWYVQTTADGYYDEYGNYYTNTHQSMELHVSDPYTNSTVDISFDDIQVSGNQLIGTVYDGHYIDRYKFSRY